MGYAVTALDRQSISQTARFASRSVMIPLVSFDGFLGHVCSFQPRSQLGSGVQKPLGLGRAAMNGTTIGGSDAACFGTATYMAPKSEFA